MSTYYGSQSSNGKVMTARFAGICGVCRSPIAAGETIRYNGQANHVTVEACTAARMAEERRKAMQAQAVHTQTAPAIDLTPIRNFIQGAKDRGLKHPKLRVLDVDGRTELSLGLTTVGHNPGSVSVKRNGEYVGLIRQDGTTRGSITSGLSAHLLTVAADPAAAAKRYAVLTCRCSFCSLPLTDEGSVEVGYGPVCAKHWGLPHAPKGTPAVAVVTVQNAPVRPGRYTDPVLGGVLNAAERASVRGVNLAAQIEAEERAMMAMEREADDEGTARDEANKAAARAAMETLPVMSSPWTPSPYAGRRMSEAE